METVIIEKKTGKKTVQITHGNYGFTLKIDRFGHGFNGWEVDINPSHYNRYY